MTRLGLLLVMELCLAGCPATNEASCSEFQLEGVACGRRMAELSESERRAYCTASFRIQEEAGPSEFECGSMSIERFTVDTCVDAFDGPYASRDPRCPRTVEFSLACWRELLSDVRLQQEAGGECSEWPVREHCDERQLVLTNPEWEYCHPRFNPDGGVGNVDGGP